MSGLKASDVVACDVCGKHPLHSGVGGGPAITFFRIRAERFVLSRRAAEQTVGMDMYFGGEHTALAEMFSPDPHIYKTSPQLATTLLVCDNCAAMQSVFALLELAEYRRSSEASS